MAALCSRFRIFASLTSILGKIGIQDVNSNLGTAIRTAVVLVMAWIVVFVTGKQNTVNNIDRKTGCSLFFPELQQAVPGYVITEHFSVHIKYLQVFVW